MAAGAMNGGIAAGEDEKGVLKNTDDGVRRPHESGPTYPASGFPRGGVKVRELRWRAQRLGGGSAADGLGDVGGDLELAAALHNLVHEAVSTGFLGGHVVVAI